MNGDVCTAGFELLVLVVLPSAAINITSGNVLDGCTPVDNLLNSCSVL